MRQKEIAIHRKGRVAFKTWIDEAEEVEIKVGDKTIWKNKRKG